MIVGSYVPDGVAVGDWVLRDGARASRAFYDIDTPVTLAKLAPRRARVPRARPDPALRPLPLVHRRPDAAPAGATSSARRVARAALLLGRPERAYRPPTVPQRWDLGYLGTYSADRQPALERLLLEPARALARRPLRRRRAAVPGRHRLAGQRRAHRAPAAARAPGLLRRPALHPERHPRRHGGGRLVAQRAAVRGRGLRRADHQRRLAGARRRCSGPGDEILLAETAEDVVRILRDLPEERRRADRRAPRASRRAGRRTPRRRARARARGAPARGMRRARRRRVPRAAGGSAERGGQDGASRPARQASSSPAAPASSARICARPCWPAATAVVCLDNFQTGSARQHRPSAPRTPRFSVVDARHHRGRCRRAVDVDEIYNLACAASPPQYQRDPVHTLKTSVLGALHLLERAERLRGHDPAGLDQRGLRRPGRASAARELLGQRQPGRSARLLRRGQARRRDPVLRLPPHPRRARSRSPGSSTPTGRGCTRRTAGSSPTSSPRRCAASR